MNPVAAWLMAGLSRLIACVERLARSDAHRPGGDVMGVAPKATAPRALQGIEREGK
ncbi:MAG: hypothetical protein AAGA95_17290 [Pseudomonadota bacterium]